jgi:hypothetical protein
MGLSLAAACGSDSSARAGLPRKTGHSSPDLTKREAALRGGRALLLLATVKIASRPDDSGN